MTEDELDEALGAYDVSDPPEGFADRVMNATQPAEPPRRRRAPWIAVGVASAAAAAAALLWPAASVQGSLHAVERTETQLGERGIAVAEAGAEIAWTVDDAHADVTQDAGDVFYRAEPSESFVVRTPAGTVTVRGTCFRVEVLDMNVNPQLFAGAAAGALIAGAVVVTVYEGEVQAQNDHGAVALEAGERSVMTPSEPPTEARDVVDAIARAAAARPEPRADMPSDEEIANMDSDALRAQLRDLNAQSQERAHEIDRLRGLLDDADLNTDAGRGHFFPASSERLRQWADACQLRLDQPPVMGMQAGRVGEHAQTLGLSPEEEAAVQDAIERVHSSLSEDLRALYIEATGDAAGAGHLSPRAMLAEIQDKASPNEGPGVLMNQIARERAGLVSAPTDSPDQSATERAVRRYARVGDDFQNLLGQSLGADRAYELRAGEGGWPWSHSIFSGCPDD